MADIRNSLQRHYSIMFLNSITVLELNLLTLLTMNCLVFLKQGTENISQNAAQTTCLNTVLRDLPKR